MHSTKRERVLTFARMSGLRVTSERLKSQGNILNIMAYCPKTDWVDCFDSWEEIYEFFFKATEARRWHDTPEPWAKAA